MSAARLLLIASISAICVIAAYPDEKKVNTDVGAAVAVAGLLEEEAALTVMMLHTENRELKERVARQEGEIERLQRKLAEAMARLDLGKVEFGDLERAAEAGEGKVSLKDLTKIQVLDVNRDMKVVVVGGGMRAGMKIGMLYSVVREDEVIAVIKLVDVRERMAGGLIEKMMSSRYPESGDRLVLREAQD